VRARAKACVALPSAEEMQQRAHAAPPGRSVEKHTALQPSSLFQQPRVGVGAAIPGRSSRPRCRATGKKKTFARAADRPMP
jgi:hypothetical protein